MSSVITTFITTIAYWLVKSTVTSAYRWIFPAPADVEEEQREMMRQLLEEMKELKRRRDLLPREERSKIDEIAYTKMAESCPELLTSRHRH